MNINVTLKARFFKKVNVKSATECWPWIGAKHPEGYGNIWWRGKSLKAHRLSFQIHKGSIPRGLFVLHRCDNPNCVNPKHLYVGTQSKNLQDMMARGRRKYDNAGERNGRAKVTEAQVIRFRLRYKAGERIGDLAREAEMPWSTMDSIIKKNWKELPHRCPGRRRR